MISIVGIQDLFNVSRDARYFFVITYGLWAVVLAYVAGKYVYVDLEGMTTRHGLLFAQLHHVQDAFNHILLPDAKERAAMCFCGMHPLFSCSDATCSTMVLLNTPPPPHSAFFLQSVVIIMLLRYCTYFYLIVCHAGKNCDACYLAVHTVLVPDTVSVKSVEQTLFQSTDGDKGSILRQWCSLLGMGCRKITSCVALLCLL